MEADKDQVAEPVEDLPTPALNMDTSKQGMAEKGDSAVNLVLLILLALVLMPIAIFLPIFALYSCYKCITRRKTTGEQAELVMPAKNDSKKEDFDYESDNEEQKKMAAQARDRSVSDATSQGMMNDHSGIGLDSTEDFNLNTSSVAQRHRHKSQNQPPFFSP